MSIFANSLVLPLLIAGLQAQAASAAATDAQESRRGLAEAVAKAHRPSGSKTVIDRYRAVLVITPQQAAKQAKVENIDIQLAVRYGAKIERAPGKKPMPMLRYELNEAGKQMIRGSGSRGLWQRIDGKTERLTTKEHQTDREILLTHRRLCKQMLRFLDPGRILSQLRGSDAVRAEKLRVGRGREGKIDTLHVEGSLESFPVVRPGKQIRQEMVWMKAWVDKKTSRLRAVKVYPLNEKGQPQTQTGEFILLDKFALQDGVYVPQMMRFFQVQGEKREPNVRVRVTSIELNPELTKKDFEPGG